MEPKDLIKKISDIEQSKELFNSLFLSIPEQDWECYEERGYYDSSVAESKRYSFGEKVNESTQRLTYFAFAKVRGGRARFRFKTSNTDVILVDNFHFWMGNYTFTFEPVLDCRFRAENIAKKLFHKEIVDSVNKLVDKQNRKSWWKFWSKSYEN